jgi:nicotinamidase-related amidase
VVVGLTTSGCVRATVVDGLQHNYPVFVVPEACGDRNLSAHHASLHDMHAKYAMVIPAKDMGTQILSL